MLITVAFGQNSRHQDIFGSGDGDPIKAEAPFKPRGAQGFHIAVGVMNFSAQLFKCRYAVQVERDVRRWRNHGIETRARPVRATNGPSTRLEARMVLTKS